MSRLRNSDPDEVMPPPEFKKELSSKQIDLMERWIREGARWANHWSFEPVARPELPPVDDPSVPGNEIDRFVQARLDEEGLEFNDPAAPEVLIRRVTLDLTGLPPTPGEVDGFLGDTAADAYERLVDRLLQSSHYGEHMARYWLDAARYGDTHGLHLDNYREMWPYRDWVVGSFNRNQSYRDFMIEQLAGDLLPEPTRDQIVATGFNRCNVTTGEGGSIKEEVSVRNGIDRVVTTSTVFMGLTLECTRCHDHKYDPLTMKDFYSFYAYFNSIDGDPMDGNRKEHAPILRLPTDFQTQSLARLDGRIGAIEPRLSDPWPVVDAAQAHWEAEAIERLRAPESEAATAALVLGDWYSVGPFNDSRRFLLSRNYGPEGKPIRLTDTFKLVTEETIGWKQRSGWKDGEVHTDFGGDFAANFIYRVIKSPKVQKVRISLGTGDGLKLYLNGKVLRAKDVKREVAPDQERLELELVEGDNELLIKILNYGGSTGFYFALEEAATKLPDAIGDLVSLTAGQRSTEQQQQLREFYRDKVSAHPELLEVKAELKRLREERAAVDRAIPMSLVWKERTEPRQAYILKRGEYSQRGEEVGRATPAALPPMPEDAPQNRLGLALWLTDDRHPLTARVAVNRFWQQLFGTGLVKTAEDFGAQGEPPSHPKLLDWLAHSFRSSGWDVKRLMKRIVLSRTYRQSARVTPELLERDPENRLMARGPRFRLDAEVLRDQALFISDLLVDIQGGESVKPPQPDGLWFAVGFSGSNTVRFKADRGPDKVHRRTLYTFIKRTSPPPQMSTLDGPSREACVMRRERTNTPMQALLLLNDPQYFEAARGLGARTLREQQGSERDRASLMFRRCVGRKPDPEELNELVAMYEEELAHYREAAAAASAIARMGDSPAAQGLDRVELAAWTAVASLLLNLDEVVSKN